MSLVPLAPMGWEVVWSGGCDAQGYAQGEGVRLLYAIGMPIEASLGRYEAGYWRAGGESYTLSMGLVTRKLYEPSSQTWRTILVETNQIPAWALQIAQAQPKAKLLWDEWVGQRQIQTAEILRRDGVEDPNTPTSDPKADVASGDAAAGPVRIPIFGAAARIDASNSGRN